MDGYAALETMERQPPDLVLTDLRMPRLGGLALVREIGERFPLVPVILMTSRGNERLAVEALTAGAANYVPKMNFEKILPEVVQQVLGVALLEVRPESFKLKPLLCVGYPLLG